MPDARRAINLLLKSERNKESSRCRVHIIAYSWPLLYSIKRDAFPIVSKGMGSGKGGWNNLCKSLRQKNSMEWAPSEGRYLHAAIIMMHIYLTFRIRWLPWERMDARRNKIIIESFLILCVWKSICFTINFDMFPSIVLYESNHLNKSVESVKF